MSNISLQITLVFSALLIFESCENHSNSKAQKHSDVNSTNSSVDEIDFDMADYVPQGKYEDEENNEQSNTMESFWSNKIGASDSFRIELEQILTDKEVYVDTELFKKQNGKWILIQKFKELKDGISSLGAEVTDINNDGFNDLLFQTATAARGANVVKTLFLYDTISTKLIKIKNSSYYPNLMYNSKLNCIDAQLFYSGSTTVFLKIVADSLQEFAAVSSMNGYVTIELINQKGVRREISNKKYSENKFDDYDRFISYSPLKKRIMD